ncbi:FecR family protein [Rhizosphaericola mali]|uniref:FecR family protein n=1 Tax=Rhizosphaericola mali TaxID=2545455 RepID=A0A5P2G786_9BACT|nr:FecR family protein [Rhizosphaericola mali]QES89812.1 FecR family protein [Rhizosphaericola mali]
MADDIKDILVNYKNGTASKSELLAIYKLIHEHEDLLRKYFDDSTHITDTPELIFTDTKKASILSKIENDLLESNDKIISPFSLIRNYKYIAAAAILFFIALITFIVKDNNTIANNAPQKEYKVATNQTVSEQQQVIRNNSLKIKKIILSDKSVVNLYPHSSISFYTPFKSIERSIYLSGKAIFKVAKNKHQPFVVYSGSISTTALGTRFLVNNKQANNLKIKLFQGKIWLRKEVVSLIGWNKDLVLIPGQQMNYSYANGAVNVSKFVLRNINVAKQDIGVNSIIHPLVIKSITEDSLSVMFHQCILTDVFTELGNVFSKKINVTQINIANKYFTGIVYKSDSLKVIFSNICRMNHLGYSLNKDTIDIHPIVDSFQNPTVNTRDSLDTLLISN